MKNRETGSSFIEVLVVIVTISVLVAIAVPNFKIAFSNAKLTGCESNLKGIASSLEIYSIENDGRYPDSLDKISDNIGRPTCPSTGTFTYDDGYMYHVNPDAYTVYCKAVIASWNHWELFLPQDFPQYSSTGGLAEY